MNTNTVENFEMANKPIISTSATIQFMCMLYLCTYYIMIYSCIRMVNYMSTDTYFNKKVVEEPVATGANLEEKSVEPFANSSANEIVAAVVSSSVAEEKDVNTWYTIEDGKCRYKGEWRNGLPNGKGIKHFYKVDSYIDGNFVDGFAEGHGKQTFEQTWERTVPYYEGEFKRNLYQGKGEYHYGDGDYYKGEWKDGKYNGHGIAYSHRINRTWIGEYENDKKVEGNWVRGEI